MAKQACKCKPTDCEECPEWIFTFADLVMLMMGFFVILWVLKPPPGKEGAKIEDEQLIKILASVRDYFNFVPDSQNPDPVDAYRLMKKLQDLAPLKGPGDGGRSRLEKKGADGRDREVLSIRRGEQAVVGSRVHFEAGSDALSADSRRVLDQIVTLIKGHRNIILIRGHTSADDFTSGSESDSSLEQKRFDISIRRAKAVADYLVSQGVSAEILRVLGCSVFEPLAQRAYTPETRQLNRRVEVESTTLLLGDFQEPAGPSISPPAGAQTRPAAP